jgi:radical SAM superfamily enzyme YgiQ (UPF0313 family)
MTAKTCNVLLVAPKFNRDSFFNFQTTCKLVGARHPHAPLGLMTVAAMLPVEWNCRLIDRNVTAVTDADLDWADLVMTGSMISQRWDCLRFIAWARGRGKIVVIGGPDVTSEPHVYAQADFSVIGEAEDIINDFIAAWESGERRGVFIAEKFKVDITKTPVPRFDLIQRRDYLYYGVQFSRGCPFTCEFCDIIEMFGRVPRVKTTAQMLNELDALYRSGYRGHLDFVDDNFIGNKKAVKLFLPHLVSWQKAHDYPFEFSTEASVNLADDDALLALMREANFFLVFVGVESPDADTLVSMQKKQNTRRNLADSIHKIYHAGMFVVAGFIVGFDSEKGRVADGMVEAIEDMAIPPCMVGLLFALANTQLTRRLKGENRVFPDNWWQGILTEEAGDQCMSGLNFKTLRPRREILADYKSVLDRVYAPRAYFARVMRVTRELNRFVPPRGTSGRKVRRIGGIAGPDVVASLGLIAFITLQQPRLLGYFVQCLYTCAREKPGSLQAVVILTALYLHLGPFARRVSASIDRQIAKIDSGEWRPPEDGDLRLEAVAPPARAMAHERMERVH